MAAIQRTATGTWTGNLKGGKGSMSTTSKVLENVPFTFATRFENAPGTNPEELIAAAHAACYSMAFANFLDGQGHTPEEIRTRATISLEGTSINKMHLAIEGRVPGVDAATFERLAHEADKKCPVSNLLRNGLEITLEAKLM